MMLGMGMKREKKNALAKTVYFQKLMPKIFKIEGIHTAKKATKVRQKNKALGLKLKA